MTLYEGLRPLGGGCCTPLEACSQNCYEKLRLCEEGVGKAQKLSTFFGWMMEEICQPKVKFEENSFLGVFRGLFGTIFVFLLEAVEFSAFLS